MDARGCEILRGELPMLEGGRATQAPEECGQTGAHLTTKFNQVTALFFSRRQRCPRTANVDKHVLRQSSDADKAVALAPRRFALVPRRRVGDGEACSREKQHEK